MKKKKGVNKVLDFLLLQIPLLVFATDLLWGLMRVDFGDTPGRASYGWLFIFFVLWPSIIIYFLGYIGGFIRYIFLLNNLKSLSSWLQFWRAVGFVSFVISAISIAIGNFQVMMNLMSLNFVYTQVTLVMLIINLISVIVINIFQGKAELASQIDYRKLIIGSIIPILIAAAFLGINAYKSTKANNIAKIEIKNGLMMFNKKHDINGQVKPIDYDDQGSYVKYQLTQHNTTVYCYAQGEMIKGKYHVDENNILDDDNQLNKTILLQEPGLSKSAQKAKKEFDKQVLAQFKKDHLTRSVTRTSVADPEMNSDYNDTNVYCNLDENLDLDRLAQANRNSSNKQKSAFKGYTAITFEQAMKAHAILIEEPISFKGLEASKKLGKAITDSLKKIDCSNLPDGYYMISGETSDLDKVTEKQAALEIVGHKIKRVFSNNISREIIIKYSDM